MYQIKNTFKIHGHMMSVTSYTKRKWLFNVFFISLIVLVGFLIYKAFEIIPYSINIKKNTGNIFLFKDKYYYCVENKIKKCSDSSVFYNGKNNVFAAASNEHLYVIDGKKIIKLSADGISIAETTIEIPDSSNIDPQIYFYNDMLYISTNNSLNYDSIYDENLHNIDPEKLKSSSTHLKIDQTDYYISDNDDSYLTLAINNDKSLFISLTKKSDGTELFSTGRLLSIYDDNLFLYFCNSNHDKFNLKNKILSKSVFKNNRNISFNSAKINRNRIISVGMETNCGNIEYSNILKYHSNDVIEITDTDGNVLSTYETRKHERVVFYDNQKVVTYYKGKYITYALNDWSVIEKQSADEIKNDGSYTFETCGDSVFIFDDESGNLLNTIPIN